MNIAEQNRQALVQSEQAGMSFVNQYVPAVGSDVSTYGPAQKELMEKTNFLQRLFPSAEYKAQRGAAKEQDTYNAVVGRQAEQDFASVQRTAQADQGIVQQGLEYAGADPMAKFGIGYQMGTAQTPEQVEGIGQLAEATAANPEYSAKAAAAEDLRLEQVAQARQVAGLQLQKLEQDIELGNLTAKNTIFTQEGALRDDAAAALKPVAEFMLYRDQTLNLLRTGDALGAQAALVKLAKVLDPDSASREGEVEVIRKGSGTMAALSNSLNMAVGEGMTAESIAQFESTLAALTRPELERGQRIVQGIRDQAIRNNLDPAYALSASGVDLEVLMGGSSGGGGRRIDLTQGGPKNERGDYVIPGRN